MNLFHVLFAIAVGFIGSAIYRTYRRVTQRDAVAPMEKVSIIIFSALLGIFLLAAWATADCRAVFSHSAHFGGGHGQ